MKAQRSLIAAEQVPFDRIEQLAAETRGVDERQFAFLTFPVNSLAPLALSRWFAESANLDVQFAFPDSTYSVIGASPWRQRNAKG